MGVVSPALQAVGKIDRFLETSKRPKNPIGYFRASYMSAGFNWESYAGIRLLRQPVVGLD